MSEPIVPFDYDDDDYDDDFEDEDDLFDCHLMADGLCGKAGSEECDWECPLRNSEFFAGSEAWMRKHGSACHNCGVAFEDGEEPGHQRTCQNCMKASAP